MQMVKTMLKSRQPMRVARQYMSERFVAVEEGVPTLVYHKGMFWGWMGEKWRVLTRKEMVADLTLWLEGSAVMGTDKTSGEVREQEFVVRANFVDEVMVLLEASARMSDRETPCWLGKGEGPDPQWSVAFQDVVVEVREDGTLKEWPRTSEWFDHVVLPFPWDPNAECPTWMEATEQWGEGDPLHRELLEQWWGMASVGYRGHGRWALFFGVIRSGKGTCVQLGKWMLGKPGVVDVGIGDVGDRFRLVGVHEGRMLVVSEINELGLRDGEAVASIGKRVVGRDDVTTEQKYQDPVSGPASVQLMLVSNQVLTLPDRNQGLTGKMLLVPFTRSFLKREDFGLLERLKGEGAGVARRWLEAVGRWRKEPDPAKKWAEPKAAREQRSKLRLAMDPVGGFLERKFVAVEKGFVPDEVVWSEWLAFVKEEELGVRLGRRALFDKIEMESGWYVRRAQSGSADMRGRRGLRGLGLRSVAG